LCVLAIQGEVWWFSSLVKHEVESFKEEFWNYINKNKASYSTVEEMEYREKVFSDNLIAIEELNADPNATAEFGVNQFTDRTEEELNALRGTFIPEPTHHERSLATIKSKFPSSCDITNSYFDHIDDYYVECRDGSKYKFNWNTGSFDLVPKPKPAPAPTPAPAPKPTPTPTPKPVDPNHPVSPMD
jgi:hypothetical protein